MNKEWLEKIASDIETKHGAEAREKIFGDIQEVSGDEDSAREWVATLQPYRKRGIAGYLIQAAERDGITNGKTVGTLHARPGAVGAYRRTGYNDYCIGLELELEEKEQSKQ